MSVFVPGDHGSTFGGNPLASVIALAAMAEMEAEDYAARSAAKGAGLLAGLKSLPHPSIEEVRGRGLLVGIEVRDGVDTKALGQAFLDERVLTKETRSRTFRYAPPLIIDDAQIDEVVARTSRALDAVS